MGATAVGNSNCNDNFAGPGGVSDTRLNGIEVTAHERSIFVSKRNINRSAERSPFFCRWHERRAPAHRMTQGSAELWMENRSRMFQFPVFAYDRCLAVALRLVGLNTQRFDATLAE
jgi:hypothetical protein